MSTIFPSLLYLPNESAYEAYFKMKYCCGPVETFDGIRVWFSAYKFRHDFYESSNHDGNKDQFSYQRAERMNWIEATLKDSSAVLKQGWLKNENRYDSERRVALVKGNYVVVIAINQRNQKKAKFITAFVADTLKTLQEIQGAPAWP